MKPLAKVKPKVKSTGTCRSNPGGGGAPARWKSSLRSANPGRAANSTDNEVVKMAVFVKPETGKAAPGCSIYTLIDPSAERSNLPGSVNVTPITALKNVKSTF